MFGFWENLIIVIVVYFSGAVTILGICNVIFEIKLTFSKILKYVVAFMLLACAGYFIQVYLNNSPQGIIIKTILTVAVFVFCSKWILEMSYFRIFLTIVVIFVMAGIGNGMTLLIFSVLNLSINEVKFSFPLVLFSYFIINMTVFINLVIVKYIKFIKLSIPTKIKKEQIFGFVLNFLVLILLMFLNDIAIRISKDVATGTLFAFLNIVLFILFFVFSYINFNAYSRLYDTSSELEVQVFYNHKLQLFIDEIKKIKHSYNNLINTLNGYVKLKKWDSFKNFIQDAMDEITSINELQTLLAMKIENAALLGLIAAKLEIAKNKDISFVVSSENKISFVDEDIFFLCEALGCLMDNAIEAATDSTQRKVNIIIKENQEGFLFRVENTYIEKPVIGEIFKKGYSTKGQGRGMGLWNIKKRIDNKNNIMLNTIIEDKMFIQELIIEKEKILA